MTNHEFIQVVIHSWQSSNRDKYINMLVSDFIEHCGEVYKFDLDILTSEEYNYLVQVLVNT